MCYVLFVRRDGFLLCLSDGLFFAEELSADGLSMTVPAGPFPQAPGPSCDPLGWRVACCMLYRFRADSALVVDFAASDLGPSDLDTTAGSVFLEEDRTLDPLPSKTLGFCWAIRPPRQLLQQLRKPNQEVDTVRQGEEFGHTGKTAL